jgi:hypothetical protein
MVPRYLRAFYVGLAWGLVCHWLAAPRSLTLIGAVLIGAFLGMSRPRPPRRRRRRVLVPVRVLRDGGVS